MNDEAETEPVDSMVVLKVKCYEWECPSCNSWNDADISWGEVQCSECDRIYTVGPVLHKGE